MLALYSDEENNDPEDNQIQNNRESASSLSRAKKLKIDNSLIRLLAAANAPASFVNLPEFIEYSKNLDPNYKVPCRQTVTSSLLPKHVKNYLHKIPFSKKA